MATRPSPPQPRERLFQLCLVALTCLVTVAWIAALGLAVRGLILLLF